MKYPATVRIVEVGPRDGLQNEKALVDVGAKVALIENLVDAGIKNIECGSFVSARWVPQMADTAQVFSRLHRVPGVSYSALVPNMKGLEAAMASGVEEVALFAAASETFSRRNTNSSIEESLTSFRAVAEKAIPRKMKVRGYVSCVLGCPYEGEIAPAAVARVAKALHNIGCYEISLGDTIGAGTPVKTQTMLKAVAGDVPVERLAVHFHDTWGQALANILASLDFGVAAIDSAVGGIGGCPYAPGATGNVATEDVVYMLDGMGIETGIDLRKVAAAGDAMSQRLGRAPTSKAAIALASSRKAEMCS